MEVGRNIEMNNTVRFALSLGLALGLTAVLQAQPIAPVAGHALSRHELKKEIAAAHTPDQYNALALYFHQREQVFRDKAVDEKTEWERRKQVTVSVEVKYPAPADSARNLCGYYTYEADRMAQRAAEYEGHVMQTQLTAK
jgi:hypothetical protein